MAINPSASNDEIRRALQPFYALMKPMAQSAERDVLACFDIIPHKRATERANDFHAAFRENLRLVCDAIGDPWLRLVEEPDGKGLDAIVVTMGELQFALMWGKYDGERIRRNPTIRQEYAQEQLMLIGGLDKELDGLPVVTMGYVLADDYTQMGLPAWWLSRLALGRERVNDNFEFIEDVAIYSRPVGKGGSPEVESPRVVARRTERQELERIIQQVRSQLA